MLEDTAWRLRRYWRRLGQIGTSVLLRGWRGTFRRALEHLQQAPNGGERPASALSSMAPETSRRRLLVIEETMPVPTRDSGSLRLNTLMQLLSQEGWHVDLLCDDGRINQHDVIRLAEIGVMVHTARAPAWLRTHGSSLDVVIVCRAPIAAQYQALIRKFAPQALLVFDTVDLHFLREQRAAKILGRSSLIRRAALSRNKELGLIARSDLCLVVSEEEQALLKGELPDSRIEVLSNIHEVFGRRASYQERSGLLFVGGCAHPPNLDALQWFVHTVLPALREQEPGIRLHVIGHLTNEARSCLDREGVLLHGNVEDLGKWMDTCRVSVAPLRFGAGVKGKVNMAMSYGLPVVATSVAAEGMHLVDGSDVLLADNADDFMAAVLRAYRDPQLWLRLSDGGLTNVETHFSLEVARRAVHRLLPAQTNRS